METPTIPLAKGGDIGGLYVAMSSCRNLCHVMWGNLYSIEFDAKTYKLSPKCECFDLNT